jgi:hypothetical protein
MICYKLKPAIIHVTNWFYQKLLRDLSIESHILPLFSSIPHITLKALSQRDAWQWTFVVFGTINKGWDPFRLLEEIEIARRLHSIQHCRFISIGSAGEYGVKLWDSLSSFPNPAFTFIRLGILPADRISQMLQTADFGICVVPSLLIQKSSAVAAMISHGLPVIISSLSPSCEPWHQALRCSGKYVLLDSAFVENLGSAGHYCPVNQLEDIVERFIGALQLRT